jgi:CRP/FNR family cyclic AMP-dependent transcriptional regulator
MGPHPHSRKCCAKKIEKNLIRRYIARRYVNKSDPGIRRERMLHNETSSVDERVAMLEKSQLEKFAGDELENFARYLYVGKTTKDEIIFNEGDIEPYMCFITSGLIRIAKNDSKKNIKTICDVGPGRTFGEMSIIDGLARSASATAAEETTLLVLTKENFDKMLAENQKLALALYAKLSQMMSHRLRISDWMLVEYLYE